MKRNTVQLTRDPVLIANALAALVSLASAFLFRWTPEEQGLIIAAVVLIANTIAAFRVGDGQVAMLVAVFKAVMAVAIGFGLNWTPMEQTIVMTAVTAIGAMFTRTQVFAPVPPTTPPAL